MESVEGLGLDNYIVYNLKAFVERGYMKQDMHAQKHLRVIRTVGTGSAEELIHPLVREPESTIALPPCGYHSRREASCPRANLERTSAKAFAP